jgi:hypothetical protein
MTPPGASTRRGDLRATAGKRLPRPLELPRQTHPIFESFPYVARVAR